MLITHLHVIDFDQKIVRKYIEIQYLNEISKYKLNIDNSIQIIIHLKVTFKDLYIYLLCNTIILILFQFYFYTIICN